VYRRISSRRTSGSLAIIPGVRSEANACNDLENSESAPSAGWTDRTMSLDRYAILATDRQLINQCCTNMETPRPRRGTDAGGDVPASPTLATDGLCLVDITAYRIEIMDLRRINCISRSG